MTDVGFMPASQQWVANGMQGMAQFGDDTRKFVVFYDRTVLNEAKSREAGVPTYDVVTYVRMQDPGDNLNIADRPAREQDRQRFPRHYENYIQGKGTEQPGTPIELLFPANPELTAMMRHLKVTTIQALANLEGHALSQIGMGAEEFKVKARKYLDMAKDGEAYSHLQAELAKRDAEITALKAANEQMSERFDTIMKRIEAQALGEPAPAPAPKPKTRAATGEI